jgi:hypothetical protein
VVADGSGTVTDYASLNSRFNIITSTKNGDVP